MHPPPSKLYLECGVVHVLALVRSEGLEAVVSNFYIFVAVNLKDVPTVLQAHTHMHTCLI